MSRVGDADFIAMCADLRGKRARVRIAEDADKKHPDDQVVFEGILISSSAYGEFDLKTDDGVTIYGWPLLEIEAVDD